MSSLLILACLCLLPWSVLSVHPPDLSDHEANFVYFKETFNKSYESEFEHAKRFEIFKQNMEEAMESNRKNGRENYGITQFSDLTAEEFSRMAGGLSEGYSDVCEPGDLPQDNGPPSHDWHALGKVSQVKNQLNCQSCWAFSTIGAVESQVLITQNKNLSLSEQQLIDCDRNSNGCHGGNLISPLVYLMNNGSELSEDYPYRDVDQKCQFKSKKAAVKVSNCFSYNNVNEKELESVLHKMGPLSIGVFVTKNMHYYRQGILIDCFVMAEEPNHAVLLVGYGTENNEDYWLIKNSWGREWGEEGYFRLQRGSNQCGLLNYTPVALTLA